MKLKKRMAPVFLIVKKHIFFFSFLVLIGFVGSVVVYKILVQKPEYIYAKVKVSQGLWWASTQRPSYWFVSAIKKGDKTSFTSNPAAEILSVRYYPHWDSDQYNIYLTLKLKVSKQDKGTYYYNRSLIGVGAPVEFEFMSTQFSGTVLALSEKPFNSDYIERKITLSKSIAYPWEYDAISIGDTYHDGEEIVFEVLDKKKTSTSMVSQDYLKNITGATEQREIVTVVAKVTLQQRSDMYFFGEEHIVKIGKAFPITLPQFQFNEYYTVKIEPSG